MSKNINFKTASGRKKALENMANIEEFSNKLVFLGYGSIGTGLLPLLIKIVKLDLSKVILIDMNKNRFNHIKKGYKGKKPPFKIVNAKITKENAKDILIDRLEIGQDDIIIDCSYEISTKYMYDLCAKYGISYTNSAIEIWEHEKPNHPKDHTYYGIMKPVEEANNMIPSNNRKNNFIIGMGCNPGNVNIWTSYALEMINEKNNKIPFYSHAELAQKLGLKVVHVSERDTQISNIPKKENEYVNTWSSDAIPWYGESFTELEIGWGTHEEKIPKETVEDMSNEYQKIINKLGAFTWGITYGPQSKNITGLLIAHEECYTICKKLTLRDNNNNIIYKPSCYYIYRPCDNSLASLMEIAGMIDVDNYNDEKQENSRFMTKDIIEGRDELGCTLFFENGDIYWIGSMLDIKEARALYNNKFDNIVNATLVQVIAGYIGSIVNLIRMIKKKDYNGLMNPQDLPIKQFMEITRPLLGPFELVRVKDWKQIEKTKKTWQFDDFLI